MEGLSTLSADFNSILDDSSSSDLTLICPDGEIQVHRLIMSGRSPVFNSLLNSDMLEKTSGIVKIEEFNIEVVRAMVLYIYTAKIEDTFDDIVTLMKIGTKYLIQTLVNDCSKKLIKRISVSNVLELGVVAEVYSVQDLLESCVKFVCENLEVLGSGWKEKLKGSPQFLMGIIDLVIKPKNELLEVTRFETVHQPGDFIWTCAGSKEDSVSVQLSHAATLTSLGLFGTKLTNSIPVKISVIDSKSVNIFSSNTSYKSTGTEEPTRIPVNVNMVAYNKYIISVVIGSGSGGTTTFSGEDGIGDVNCGDKLKVFFEDASQSTNNTQVEFGQIPFFEFKL